MNEENFTAETQSTHRDSQRGTLCTSVCGVCGGELPVTFYSFV
jgi:hypothetical protein